MKSWLLTAIAAAFCQYTAAMAQSTAPANPQAADVPVKQVVLFSSGVGYFEHYGTVKGNGSTELNFKTAQINDILKSLVLQDLDGGKVSNVTYPSQDPLAKTLRSFQVDITNNPPLADLLNQLRGAAVTVSYLNENKHGIVLGVEKRPLVVLAGSPPVDTWILNLLDGATIRQLDLNKVADVKIDDPKLQEELGRALAAVAQARDQDKKPVTINFTGQGDRHVRIGYVVETPVWKTSYRLLLGGAGAEAGEKPKLQGWAIIENQTDNDWNQVQLSLVSGRPISFIQDLYQPLYVPRPTVVPEMFAGLMPRMYEDAIAANKETQPFGVAGRVESKMERRLAATRAPAAPGTAGTALSDEVTAAAAKPMNATASVASLASAAAVGELFQYTVGNVSLPRQKSAMIPIVTDDIEVEKLSIYNQSVLPKNPLNGARIKNTTGKHLLQGPMTVLEANSYAGDARIDNLPPGQERMISYGVDLQMTVDAASNKQENFLQTGKIVKGVLQLTRRLVATQDYTADNKSDHDKNLVIEHPRRSGWKLVDTEKPMETTDTLYRFKGTVAAGKASKLTVKEEIIQGEVVQILNGDLGALVYYSRAGEIPEKVRDALVKAIQLKQSVVDLQRKITEHEQQIQQITQEQNRIRENMKTVNQQSDYYKRLMTKLNDQESSIEKLQSERDDLIKARDDAQKALDDYLSNLNVG
jgi:hypothetical protein